MANQSWMMKVTGFWIKKTHKYQKTLRIFSVKNKFPQSPEIIKKYSSEYNDL